MTNQNSEFDIPAILKLIRSQGDQIERLRKDLEHLHFLLSHEDTLDYDYKHVWAEAESNQ